MSTVRRYGMAVRLRPERADEYRRMHRETWPEVLAALRRCGIGNYSIYQLGDLLFSYFEYGGSDLATDLARSEEDPVVARWERICDSCFLPVMDGAGPTWVEMQELFHLP
jgi:L-rhamnose mutarotase